MNVQYRYPQDCYPRFTYRYHTACKQRATYGSALASNQLVRSELLISMFAGKSLEDAVAWLWRAQYGNAFQLFGQELYGCLAKSYIGMVFDKLPYSVSSGYIFCLLRAEM